MAPAELNSSGNRGATRDQASVKVPSKDPKKKEDKKDEDLSEEDLALKQLLELYVERVQDPDPGLQKTALEGMSYTMNSKVIQKGRKKMENALVIYEAPNKRRRNEKHNNPRLDDDFVENGDEAPKWKKPATRNALDKENDKAKAKGKGKALMFNEEDISEEKEDGDMDVNAGTEEDAEDESFPSLPSRCNLITFTKTLSKLNEKQVSAIDEMGFQAVRDLNINIIPSRLAYWVVDNFNHNSSELLLTRNRRILVTEDDVMRVYGFPKGKKFVQRFQKKDES
ncbi:hypothetical protein OROMI_012766 [Orobanche minor]